jgi:hypothetical protein
MSLLAEGCTVLTIQPLPLLSSILRAEKTFALESYEHPICIGGIYTNSSQSYTGQWRIRQAYVTGALPSPTCIITTQQAYAIGSRVDSIGLGRADCKACNVGQHTSLIGIVKIQGRMNVFKYFT